MTKKYLQAYGALYGDLEPPKPSRKRRIGKTLTEAQLQQQCVAWFKRVYPNCLINSTPNEGKRQSHEGARLVSMGLSAGHPDITIPEPRKCYHGLYIELKRDAKAVVRDNQLWWIEKLVERGYHAQVVRSFDEFCLVVKNYLD